MTTESVSSVGSTHSSAMLLKIVTSDEDKGNTTSGFQERPDEAVKENSLRDIDLETFDYAKEMEPSKVRRRRYLSIGVICLVAFIYVFSFTIAASNAKPYLDKMDPSAGTRFLGIFIASQALAQLVSSPIVGFLANKIGSVRWLLMFCYFITGFGFAFYASVSAFPSPRKWYLLGARLILGLSGGSSTLCYSYIATATTVKERSTVISLFQMSKSVAIVVGPLVQAAFLPLGTGEEHPVGDTGLYFNVFTVPAWIAVLLCLLNVVLLLPCLFTEFHMAKEEGEYLIKMHKKNDETSAETERRKPDKPALVVCIFLFAIFQFHFNILDSLTSLLAMEQLGMSPAESIFKLSIFFACAGVYNILCFGAVGFFARKIEDRKLLCFGLICIFLGPLCMYPYGGPPPPLKASNDTYTLSTPAQTTSKTELYLPSSSNVTLMETLSKIPEECVDNIVLYDGGGCPAEKQPWCCHTPAPSAVQLGVGYIVLITGVPVGLTMSNGIMSKILGPYPQGTWTGMLGAGSAIARILCPLSVTNLYTSFGTGPTFGFLNAVLLASAFVYAFFYQRLVPFRYDLPKSSSNTSTTTATNESEEPPEIERF